MVERPCPVVMVSSLTQAGAEATFEAMELGAVDFIAKPAGAVSLAIEELAPELTAKVKAAAKARLRNSLRLAERVRLRLHASHNARADRRPEQKPSQPVLRPAGLADAVVLVGSSTGGPPALDALLSPLPADFPWPILVAQHMPANFTGPLARRLDKLCALTVVEVTQAMPLTSGHVYIGAGDADVVVGARGGNMMVTPVATSSAYRWHPSVDRLVTTAMQHIGASNLIGVLMTGMGDDGAAAMTRLHQEGGRTIAEAEETAVIWGMPGELVKAGGADVVAPLDMISAQLLAWSR
jgi:two-component system chemotaxis response regulator CheB